MALRERLRKHFRSAIAQERGRATCFPVTAVSGAAEHEVAVESCAELPLSIDDVVDLHTLQKFRRERLDMPSNLRLAVAQLTGAVLLNYRLIKRLAHWCLVMWVTISSAMSIGGHCVADDSNAS